jgi:hypothetical protein
MHGGILGIRKVIRGKDHPSYKNKGESRQEREERSKHSATLLYLRDIGDHLNMFNGGHTRGRKPNGYIKIDSNEPEQLLLAIKATINKKEVY